MFPLCSDMVIAVDWALEEYSTCALDAEIKVKGLPYLEGLNVPTSVTMKMEAAMHIMLSAKLPRELTIR